MTADFLISISGAAGAYSLTAHGPDEISVPPTSFRFQVSPELAQDLDAIRAGGSPSRRRMEAVGGYLFTALFPRPVLQAYARSAREGLRLKLAVHPPELARLPWELLFNPDEGYFLATRRTSPIVRLVESGQPVAPLLAPRPLRLLYVQSAPPGLPALDLAGSERALRQALGSQAEIQPLAQPVTAAGLRQALHRPVHILHYDGHAFFDEGESAGYLCLAGEGGGRPYPLSGEQLAGYLDGTGVRLVVLAACESAMDAQQKRFAGIAHQLMKSSSLPAVVAHQFSIPDTSVIAFNRGFYAALAGGLPVDTALVEGRMAILESLGGDPFAAADWATPVLFMRAADGQIFGRAAGALQPQEDRMEKDDERPAGGIRFGDNANVRGDVFTGGKHVTVGNISNVSGGTINIAGGDIIQTNLQPAGGLSAAEVARLFETIFAAIRARSELAPEERADLQFYVEEIQALVSGAGEVKEDALARHLRNIQRTSRPVLEVVLTTLNHPQASFGPAFSRLAARMSA